MGNSDPDAGLHATVGAAEHCAAAVTENETAAPAPLVHAVVMSLGHWIVGPL